MQAKTTIPVPQTKDVLRVDPVNEIMYTIYANADKNKPVLAAGVVVRVVFS